MTDENDIRGILSYKYATVLHCSVKLMVSALHNRTYMSLLTYKHANSGKPSVHVLDY
jgi:hypothetical protein